MKCSCNLQAWPCCWGIALQRVSNYRCVWCLWRFERSTERGHLLVHHSHNMALLIAIHIEGRPFGWVCSSPVAKGYTRAVRRRNCLPNNIARLRLNRSTTLLRGLLSDLSFKPPIVLNASLIFVPSPRFIESGIGAVNCMATLYRIKVTQFLIAIAYLVCKSRR